MVMELIEKKNTSIKTKVQFTKKEWENIPLNIQKLYEKEGERHDTKRLVYFIIDGDLINHK